MKKIFLIIIILLAGCHSDNRTRIESTIEPPDYENSQKMRRLRVLTIEHMHAKVATQKSSFPTKPR
jgi:hypothetical protein